MGNARTPTVQRKMSAMLAVVAHTSNQLRSLGSSRIAMAPVHCAISIRKPIRPANSKSLISESRQRRSKIGSLSVEIHRDTHLLLHHAVRRASNALFQQAFPRS